VEEADRINQILNTLVDIAEAEARIGKIEGAATALEKVVHDGIDSYTEFAEASGVAVTSKIPSEIFVGIDNTSLFRVIANLIDNAIKYTPAGGNVMVTAKALGREVEVRVADTGVGIPPEDLPRIWDRLFRSDRSRSRRGLGLGLSLVRAIVESHGGSVGAESQPGMGTTIRVILPMAKGAANLEAIAAGA
jgi:signal transduction histidine kinase